MVTMQSEYVYNLQSRIRELLRRRLFPDAGLLHAIEPSFTPLRLHQGIGRLAFHTEPSGYAHKIIGIKGVVQQLQEQQTNVAFLLGPAGSGKTTLLARFCHDLCQSLLESSPLLSSTNQSPWPYWLPCPELVHDDHTLPSPPRPDAPIVYLFDGLDEVVDGDQLKVLERLSEFLRSIQQKPGALAIATCRSEEINRIHGTRMLLGLYPSYSLEPPDANGRREIFRELARLHSNPVETSLEPAIESIEHLLQSTDYAEAFQTPLLLSLFAFVALNRPESITVGLRRAQVYHESFEILAKQRLTHKQFLVAGSVLQTIAKGYYIRGEAGQASDVVLDQDDLLRIVSEQQGTSLDSSITYLELAQRSGMLIGDYGKMAFIHRSFFEYFISLCIKLELLDDKDEKKQLFSQSPFSENVLSFLFDLGATNPIPLAKVLDSTRLQSFESVGYRGGNAINLLRRTGTEPRNANLQDAVLAGADLRGADLRGVYFGTADLRYADYSYAQLDEADWTNVSFIGHLQIEEGKEIRSIAYSEQADTVFFGNARGEIISLRGKDLSLTRRMTCHKHSVTAISLDENNGWLISTGYDESCQIQDSHTLKILASVPRRLPKCRALASYSPYKGICFFACGTIDDTILLYRAVATEDDLSEPSQLRIDLLQMYINVGGSPYRSISWTTDGHLILIGGFDGNISWLRFLPNSPRVEPILILDVPKDVGTIWGTTISKSGQHAATLDDRANLFVWNIENTTPRIKKNLSLNKWGIQVGRCVCLDDNESLTIYAGSDDGKIVALVVKDAKAYRIWRREPHSDSVYDLRLIHDGQHLLSCSLDGRIVLTDTSTGQPCAEFADSDMAHIAASRLSLQGLRIRMDLVEAADRFYLQRRGVIFTKNFEFDVALSFAGKDRSHAEELAGILINRGYRVFYDQEKKSAAALWGAQLKISLREIYGQLARFFVAFCSANYVKNKYTRLELSAAKQRLRRDRDSNYILAIRLDNSQLPGISKDDAYVSIERGIPYIADLIEEKIKLARQKETPPSAGTG